MKLSFLKRGDERPVNAPLEPVKATGGKRRKRRSGLSLGIGHLILVLGFTVATTGAGIYTVFSQYQVVKMGYAIDQELFEYRRALEANKRLRLSISSYKHPSAVQAFADEALDMRQPSNADELIVPDPNLADPTSAPASAVHAPAPKGAEQPAGDKKNQEGEP